MNARYIKLETEKIDGKPRPYVNHFDHTFWFKPNGKVHRVRIQWNAANEQWE